MSLIRFPLELQTPQKVAKPRRPETWREVILSGLAVVALLGFIVYVLIPLVG